MILTLFLQGAKPSSPLALPYSHTHKHENPPAFHFPLSRKKIEMDLRH